jgi:hypothetical protein
MRHVELLGDGRMALRGTTVGLAAVALLAAAGCGSTAPGTFHPGAGTASAAGDGTPAPAVSSVPFPSSVHFNFETPLPADAGQASVVVTDEDYQLAYYYAIYSLGQDQRFGPYIAARPVLEKVQATVAQDIADHERFTGTMRFFDTTVAPTPGAATNMTVSFCGDDSQLLNTSAGTGQVIPDHTAPPDQDYFRESDTYLPTKNGGWGLVAIDVVFYPGAAAKECKP